MYEMCKAVHVETVFSLREQVQTGMGGESPLVRRTGKYVRQQKISYYNPTHTMRDPLIFRNFVAAKTCCCENLSLCEDFPATP